MKEEVGKKRYEQNKERRRKTENIKKAKEEGRKENKTGIKQKPHSCL